VQKTSRARISSNEVAPYDEEKKNEREGKKESCGWPSEVILAESKRGGEAQVALASIIMSSAPDQLTAATNGNKRAASPAPDDSNSKARLEAQPPTTSISTSTDTPPALLVQMGNTESKTTEPAPEATAEPVAPAEASGSTTQKAERAPGVDPRQLDTLATLYSQDKLEAPEATAFEHVAALNDKVVLW
jgi:hypothetical protein